MARHRVSLEDFPNILAALPGRFTTAAIVGLRSASQRLVGYTVEEIMDVGAVASGELSRSVRSHALSDGAVVQVEAPHGDAVEHGSRPHWAPIRPLIDWVITKGLATSERDARSIAYAVQATIARRGTRPRRYFRRAVNRVKPEIIEHIIAEWNKL